MKLIRGCDTMDNKPFFIDEKELAALKKNMEEKEEVKTVNVEEMHHEEEKPLFVEETKNVIYTYQFLRKIYCVSKLF